MEALIASIVDEFVDDVSVFQAALEDFIAFVDMERRRASLIEQRTIDAEDGRAKSELARSTVQDVLNQKVAGKRLPSVVIKLLQDGWSNVLFLICLKEGQDSESWARALQTADDLLESVSPVDSLADRARLLRLLPSLLKNLRSGLNKIGFNPFDLNQLFTDLEQIHLLRLKKEETADLVAPLETLEPIAAEVLVPVVASEAIPAQNTLDEMLGRRQQSGAPAPLAPDVVESLADLDRELAEHFGEGSVLQDAPVAATVEPVSPVQEVVFELDEDAEVMAANAEPLRSREERAVERVNGLQVGNWVELKQGGGSMLRCRLAAIIRATGKYIFVNRAGVKVAENNRDGLLRAYMRGELIMLDEGRLFDRALESVIGNLRDMKARPSN